MSDEEFTALFQEYYGPVLAYGLRRVDASTAHDVAAEVFAVAWRRLDSPPDVPLAWLLAVARRVMANELRRRTRAEALHLRLAAEPESVPAAMPAPGPADGEPPGGPVQAAWAQLSAADQEVLALVAWEGLDHAGAAAVLRCSTGALRVRLHRARRRLEAAITRGADPPPSERSRPLARTFAPTETS